MDARLESAPEAARPFLLDFTWSLAKLKALPLETVELPLAPLAGCLEAPLWPRAGKPFQMTPEALMRDQNLDPEQYERVLNASLGEPIYVTRQQGYWLILDGTDRLAKAQKLGYEKVRVKVVPVALLESIAQ